MRTIKTLLFCTLCIGALSFACNNGENWDRDCGATYCIEESFSDDYSELSEQKYFAKDLEEYCTCEELRILRNAIYARHGRKFKSRDLQEYFESKDWYKPRNTEVTDAMLSPIEKHNIKEIQKAER